MMRRRSAFALMVALWMLIAISAVSLEISVLARGRRLAAANTLELEQARAAAQSGVEHARARLARALVEGGFGTTWGDARAVLDPWHRVGVRLPDSIAIGDNAWYRVHFADLGARLNVNTASDATIAKFFAGLGVDAVVAARLADAILDWRDADDFRRSGGAEAADYMRAGYRELPRNGAFASIDELQMVHGMTPVLFGKIASRITVYGSGQVNVNVADRTVLQALPGITPLAAELIERAQRENRHIGTIQQLTDLMPTAARGPLEQSLAALLPLVTFDTHELLVTSEGWVVGSPVRAHEDAVIERGGRAAFVIWRRGH